MRVRGETEARVQAAAVEDAVRIECALEALVDRRERRRQRREHAGATCRGAKQRRVAADRRGRARSSAAGSAVRSQRCAPCHSISSSPARPSSGAVGGSDRRHRVGVLVLDRLVGGDEERIGVVAQAPPERVARRPRSARRRARSAASHRGRARRAGARSGCRSTTRWLERQRLRRPTRASAPARRSGVHVEAQRRLGLGRRQHLERHLDDRRRGCRASRR